MVMIRQLRVERGSLETQIQAYARLENQEMGRVMGDDEASSNVRVNLNFLTRWAGLTPNQKESDVWVLHTHPIAN
jgi:hypothetical protein